MDHQIFYTLQTSSSVEVQVSQLSGRSHAESHFVIIVDDPPPILVSDVADVVTGVTAGAHVRDEGSELVARIKTIFSLDLLDSGDA